MKKPLVITSCCILLTLSAGTAPVLTAQENQSESKEQQSQTESEEKAAQKEKSEQSGEADEEESASAPRNTTGGFRPSEEISEDLSVSFPVDI